ncbi:hypothetical protein WMY93_011728 [Mugilogobius chulae]|uniref:FISNA domain-containing protein n=1 Tax=Mugilogobius chulae TaxID=88201 RepID=A0AAW0PCB9_9GOBI
MGHPIAFKRKPFSPSPALVPEVVVPAPNLLLQLREVTSLWDILLRLGRRTISPSPDGSRVQRVIITHNWTSFSCIWRQASSLLFEPSCRSLREFWSLITQNPLRVRTEKSRGPRNVLNLTVDFLRRMKQNKMADRLQSIYIYKSQRNLKTNLQQKFNCVFEGVARAGNPTLLNQIYTELYITKGETEGVNEEHEVRQIETTSGLLLRIKYRSLHRRGDRGQRVHGSTKGSYFKKRFPVEKQAKAILAHVKAARSLYIMCHIPIFCWIAATVLEHVMKTNSEDRLPKTLTEMYIYFLVVQIKVKSLKFDGRSEMEPQWNPTNIEMVESLARLAFEQLLSGNLIFYESDLANCNVDVNAASSYSGVFTQVFREEPGLYQDKVYCFVHLSVQEFLAALQPIALLLTSVSTCCHRFRHLMTRRLRRFLSVGSGSSLKESDWSPGSVSTLPFGSLFQAQSETSTRSLDTNIGQL